MFINSEIPNLIIKLLSKPSTSGNYVSNIVLEWIHQVIGNLVWTYNIKKTYADEY